MPPYSGQSDAKPDGRSKEGQNVERKMEPLASQDKKSQRLDARQSEGTAEEVNRVPSLGEEESENDEV